MTERRLLPDPVCGSICKLSMSERCIEYCAPNQEMELLEVREDLTIDQMPRYRIREDLKWKARFRLQEAYTQKLVDAAQGIHPDPVKSVRHRQKKCIQVDIPHKDIFLSGV